MPGIAQLSREIRIRRYGADQPRHYPQWVDTDITRPVTPPRPYTYVIKPVALGLVTLFSLEWAREYHQFSGMLVIGIAGVIAVALSTSDGLQKFKRQQDEKF